MEGDNACNWKPSIGPGSGSARTPPRPKRIVGGPGTFVE